MRNITLTGGACPARAYIEELMPDILDGTIEPGRVFDRTVSLDEVPDGYRPLAGDLATPIRPGRWVVRDDGSPCCACYRSLRGPFA